MKAVEVPRARVDGREESGVGVVRVSSSRVGSECGSYINDDGDANLPHRGTRMRKTNVIARTQLCEERNKEKKQRHGETERERESERGEMRGKDDMGRRSG